VPIVVDPEIAEQLIKAAGDEPGLVVEIDVAARTLSVPEMGLEVTFPLDDFTQHRLLEGLDDIGLSLRNADAIDAYEASRPVWMPVTVGA
jgi:3-isopropylmalate/(R)-2-methylmalate dehydratase small subunit